MINDVVDKIRELWSLYTIAFLVVGLGSAIALFGVFKSVTRGLENLLSSWSEIAFGMADGEIVTEEMTASFNVAVNETINASDHAIEETLIVAMTPPQLDPITSTAIEYAMRGTPLFLGFGITLVFCVAVLMFLIFRWYKR